MAGSKLQLLILLGLISSPIVAWLSSRQAVSSYNRYSHLASADGSSDESEELLKQAQELRSRVASLEEEKGQVQAKGEADRRLLVEEQQALRERYSAIVPILKPDGNNVDERVSFRPLTQNGSSYITTVEAGLPLGIILGESETFTGTTVVDEVSENGNGHEAGIQVGDIVRALTACKVEMELPTWQVLAGGIGRPKLRRFVYSADGRPIEEVLEAVGSNRQDPEERPVLFVVERQDK